MKEDMLAYQKGKHLPTGGQTIRVFSLEGEPLKEYKFDHSVSGIWVMEEEGRMWALDVNSDEPLVEYRLKWWRNENLYNVDDVCMAVGFLSGIQ